VLHSRGLDGQVGNNNTRLYWKAAREEEKEEGEEADEAAGSNFCAARPLKIAARSSADQCSGTSGIESVVAKHNGKRARGKPLSSTRSLHVTGNP
jgi:hypothetical protein